MAEFNCPFNPGAGRLVQNGLELDDFLQQAQVEGVLTKDARERHRALTLDLALGKSLSLSTPELAFAARLAWRNNAQCIGRLYWRSLFVKDRREVETTAEMYQALVEHLEITQGRLGSVRPVMTIFAPVDLRGRGLLIRNRQLASYAGYRTGSTVLGDPLNCDLTQEALDCGWVPPRVRSAFDLLPWILREIDGRRRIFPVPRELIREVKLSHPSLSWFEALGLRWYSVPIVCDMALKIANTTFGLAPFSGWYMSTEIGCRNLADERRYNLLPIIAEKMGLDQSATSSLWRERAMVELNTAVLHSFAQAGCRMVDHHTASKEFVQFCALEEAAGRKVSADWSWLVPPLAGSATKVFHRPMTDLGLKPEIVRRRRIASQ
jgi:nitric-oxide synthase, bacterial